MIPYIALQSAPAGQFNNNLLKIYLTNTEGKKYDRRQISGAKDHDVALLQHIQYSLFSKHSRKINFEIWVSRTQ